MVWLVAIVSFVVIVAVAVHQGDKDREKFTPIDSALREETLAALQAGDWALAKIRISSLINRFRQINYTGGDRRQDANRFYRLLLEYLSKEPSLKPQALELGRLTCGLARKDGLPTVYDEAAIANDIAAHS